MRPVSQSSKTRIKVQPPESLNVLSVHANVPNAEAQEDGSGADSSDSEPEPKTLAPINDQQPAHAQNPMACLSSHLSRYHSPDFSQTTLSPINLLQVYFVQISNGTFTPAPPPQVALPTIPQPPAHQSKKPLKGIKGYPDGWQQVLNGAKDVVRGSVLIKDPFPSLHLA